MKKVLGCIELYVIDAQDGEVGAIISLPGRDGTLTYRAPAPHGRPSPASFEALSAALQKWMLDCIMLSGVGLQGQLEGLQDLPRVTRRR